MSTMQAEFEALTSEGGEWDDTATALGTAADTVAGLQLSSAQFSFISGLTGVADSYAQARQHVEDVLRAGQEECTQLGNALRQVRNDFQSTDQGVVNAVSALWTPE
jgi:type VII secretion effector (TIGR04197 family)